MAKTNVQLRSIDDALRASQRSFVTLSKVAAPFTTVLNRALITDFSQDLMPRMGVQRIPIQAIQEIQGEVGPGRERVFGSLNDFHGQVRLAGSWQVQTDTHGTRVVTTAANAYLEITYFGTGLNLLVSGGGHDARESTDGGPESANLVGGVSSALAGRSHAQNIPVNVKTGLTLGLHTTRIRTSTGSLDINGFEILNESINLVTPPGSVFKGGRKLSLLSQNSQSHRTPFASGVLGTKGGRVIVYLDADGVLKKALTPTDTTQLNLASASHANEELVRTYNHREFSAPNGPNRSSSEDFGTLDQTTSNRGFTLDDGTTTLTGTSIRADEGVQFITNGTGNIYFTFIGTGLDIKTAPDTPGGSNTFDVQIDNVSVGSFTNTDTGVHRIIKIVSGLPYGTHTVNILRNTAVTATPEIRDFLVYGPKRPTIPVNAVELADYNILADFAFAPAIGGAYPSGSGTIVKSPSREFSYSGTWGTPVLNSGYHDYYLITSTNGSTAALEFTGTGIILSMSYGTSGTLSVQVDGVNYTGAATVGTGVSSGSWTPGTSTWVLTGSQGSKLAISGLAYGRHKVQVTVVSQTGGIYQRGWEVITPVHSPVEISPGVVENSSSVAFHGVRDLRMLLETQDLDIPNWAQAVGVTLNPTTTVAAGLVPLADMLCVVKTNGNPIQVAFTGAFYASAANTGAAIKVYVDGVPFPEASKDPKYSFSYANGFGFVNSDNVIVPVAAGVHIVQLYWQAVGAGAVAIAYNNMRNMNVREL